MRDTKVITAIYDALNKAALTYSAMSWSGFNLVGDKKSIDKLTSLVHHENSIETFWRPEVIKLRAEIEALKNANRVFGP